MKKKVEFVPDKYYRRYLEIVEARENLLLPINWDKPDFEFRLNMLVKRVFSLSFIVPFILISVLIAPVMLFQPVIFYYGLVLINFIISYRCSKIYQDKRSQGFLDDHLARKLKYESTKQALKPFDHQMAVEIAKINNIKIPLTLTFADMYRLFFNIEKYALITERPTLKIVK